MLNSIKNQSTQERRKKITLNNSLIIFWKIYRQKWGESFMKRWILFAIIFTLGIVLGILFAIMDNYIRSFV